MTEREETEPGPLPAPVSDGPPPVVEVLTAEQIEEDDEDVFLLIAAWLS